jgi:hypothetical protein
VLNAPIGEVGRASINLTAMNSSAEPSEQPPEATSIDVPKAQRFRWAMIPAVLSWFMGAVMLLSCAAAVYGAFGARPLEPGEAWPFVVLKYECFLAIPAFLIGGTITLLAGSRWLSRRWISAVVLNVIGYGLGAIPSALHDYAMDAAYRAMDAEDAAFYESLKADSGVEAESQ